MLSDYDSEGQERLSRVEPRLDPTPEPDPLPQSESPPSGDGDDGKNGNDNSRDGGGGGVGGRRSSHAGGDGRAGGVGAGSRHDPAAAARDARYRKNLKRVSRPTPSESALVFQMDPNRPDISRAAGVIPLRPDSESELDQADDEGAEVSEISEAEQTWTSTAKVGSGIVEVDYVDVGKRRKPSPKPTLPTLTLTPHSARTETGAKSLSTQTPGLAGIVLSPPDSAQAPAAEFQLKFSPSHSTQPGGHTLPSFSELCEQMPAPTLREGFHPHNGPRHLHLQQPLHHYHHYHHHQVFGPPGAPSLSLPHPNREGLSPISQYSQGVSPHSVTGLSPSPYLSYERRHSQASEHGLHTPGVVTLTSNSPATTLSPGAPTPSAVGTSPASAAMVGAAVTPGSSDGRSPVALPTPADSVGTGAGVEQGLAMSPAAASVDLAQQQRQQQHYQQQRYHQIEQQVQQQLDEQKREQQRLQEEQRLREKQRLQEEQRQREQQRLQEEQQQREQQQLEQKQREQAEQQEQNQQEEEQEDQQKQDQELDDHQMEQQVLPKPQDKKPLRMTGIIMNPEHKPTRARQRKPRTRTFTFGEFKCSVTGCTAKSFRTEYLLNSHMNVHSESRPHLCDHPGCSRAKPGEGFKRRNELVRHWLVHQSPGYICPFCVEKPRRYPRPDNLLRHVNIQHGDINKDNSKELRDVLALRPEGSKQRGRRKQVDLDDFAE